MTDGDDVVDIEVVAAGRWFLLLLEYGPDDERTVRALDHARRLGVDEQVVQWASTSGLVMAHEIAEDDA